MNQVRFAGRKSTVDVPQIKHKNHTFQKDIVHYVQLWWCYCLVWNAEEPFLVGYLVYFESKSSCYKVTCSVSFIRYEGLSWGWNLSDRYDTQSSALKKWLGSGYCSTNNNFILFTHSIHFIRTMSGYSINKN